MNNKYVLIAIFFFVTSASPITLAISYKKATSSSPHTNQNPDYFILKPYYIKFNHSGKIKSKITADRILFSEKNNTFYFEKPDITMYRNKKKTWNLKANNGESKIGKHNVNFWDNVQIQKFMNSNQPMYVFKTKALTTYPNKKIAKTNKYVTIIQKTSKITAIGAIIDFERSIINFISSIKVTFNIE